MQQASARPDAIKFTAPHHLLKSHLDNWEVGVLARLAAHLCRCIKRRDAITGSVESQGVTPRPTPGIKNIPTSRDMD